jgi:hypothetical protein
MVSIFFDLLSPRKISTAPSMSWTNFFEIARKGYQKKQFLSLIYQKGAKLKSKNFPEKLNFRDPSPKSFANQDVKCKCIANFKYKCTCCSYGAGQNN